MFISLQFSVFGYCSSSFDKLTFIIVKTTKIIMKMMTIMVNTTIFLLFRRLVGSYKFSHIIFEGSDASSTFSVTPKSFNGSLGGIGFPNYEYSVLK
jgi:hypothetical protein